MNEYPKYLSDLLNQFANIRFDTSRLSLVFNEDLYNALSGTIDSEQVTVEKAGNKEVEIFIENLPFYFYFDEQDFKSRVTKDKWDKPSFIYKQREFYDPENGKTDIGGVEKRDYSLALNNHKYFELLHFLKTKEHKEDTIFYFVDYFSWDSSIIVFTTLKKEGKLTITIPGEGISLSGDLNLTQHLTRFKDAFLESNKQLPKFIKNELIGQLAKFDTSKRMEQLLLKLGEIMNVADQNFEIYLHDLSLENLKKEFIEFKNKYFNQLREILSKLTNQVIGLPITIAASVFSTYKVSDSPSTLSIILFVFLLYAGYSIFLLKLQKEDIRDIKEMFTKDYSYLENSTFFRKFPSELTDFNTANIKIQQRIRHLIQAVNIYYILFVSSLIAFIIYILLQLAVSFSTIFIAAIILLILCLLAFYLMLR